MKVKTDLEQFSFKENRYYDEYITFDTENPSYSEHIVFPTDNICPHEFADDEILSERYIEESSETEKRSSEECSQNVSNVTPIGTTGVTAPTNGIASVVAKITAGLSVTSFATVAIFVVATAYVLQIIPGFSQSFYKIRSLTVISNAVICDILIDYEAEEQYEIHVFLYTESEEYFEVRRLFGGENKVEFMQLMPNTDYIFEINVYEYTSGASFAAEEITVHTSAG